MTYKATIRIPTEQYAYLEIETDGTPEHILETYREFNRLMKGGGGLDTKTFNQFLENQLNGGDNEMETYLAMSPEQQMVVQEIKKTIKRIQAKENKLHA